MIFYHQCQKVSLLQRFFGFEVSHLFFKYREMSGKRVEMQMGILRPYEQNTMNGECYDKTTSKPRHLFQSRVPAG